MPTVSANLKSPGVYSITNIITGDFYIGSAVNIDTRWKRHIRDLRQGIHHNSRIQRAWLKYGEGVFQFEIIRNCDKDVRIAIEQFHLDELKPTYNFCKIAGTPSGVPVSDETREKLRRASTGRIVSDEVRNILRIRALNMPLEHRAKIAAALRGRKASVETKAKQSLAKLGILGSPEMRERMRVVAANRPPHYYDALRTAGHRSVICVDTGIKFGSIILAQQWLRENGHPKASRGNISTCCQGERNFASGYRWKYAKATSPECDVNV